MISHQGALANAAPQWARTGDSSYGVTYGPNQMGNRAPIVGLLLLQFRPWLVID
jgi:hypothetical protein